MRLKFFEAVNDLSVYLRGNRAKVDMSWPSSRIRTGQPLV